MAPARTDTPERFASTFVVSREILERLRRYEALLRQWQKGTNLVAPKTLDDVWHRHFADSAQLLALTGENWRTWVDLGSGAGFPGLVIAVCAPNREDRRVHLIESNARKCAFLREVVRETGCPVEIHQMRIESVADADRVTPADVVSARALAPLDELLGLSAPFFSEHTVGLFPKGLGAGREQLEAARNWRYEAELHPSLTDAQARIVRVTALRRKAAHVEAAHE